MKTNPELQQSNCKHCGNRLQRGQTDYCCPGCQTVATVLQEKGWDRFYQLRLQDPQPLLPQPGEEQDFEYLGSDAYRQEYVRETGKTWQFTWYLQGVHCAACLWLVNQVGQEHDDVLAIHCRLEDGKTEISTKPHSNLIELAKQFEAVGLPPTLAPETETPQDRDLLRLGLSGALAANIMLFSLPFYVGLEDPRFLKLFGSLAAFLSIGLVWIGGQPFFQKAWHSLRNKRFHFDQPIAIGIASALVLSLFQLIAGSIHKVYFDSMAMLVFFLLLGRYLRIAMLKKARKASEQLVKAMPRMVRIWRNQKWQLSEATQIVPGDLLKLFPGDVLPVDGVLDSNQATVNLQAVTGEEHPTTPVKGETLLAGTINLSQPAEVIATSSAKNATLTRLEDLSRDLQQKKPSFSQSRLAGYFLTGVFIAAALGLVIWWAVSPLKALETALTIFIVACPCALALASPTAQAFAIHRAVQAGLWIKNLRVFQVLPEITEFVFDKTGVLTAGEAEVVSIKHFTKNPKWVESAIATLEADIDHPVAWALRKAFTPRLALGTAKRLEVKSGVGVSGEFDNKHVCLTARQGFQEFGIPSAQQSLAEKACDTLPAETSQVCVFVNHRLAAVIGLLDRSRPEAMDVIQALKHQGLQTAVLSGDRQAVVSLMGKQLGTHVALGQQMPEQKLAYLQAAQKHGAAMMGDGLNDMGALAAANVSFTHAKGSSAALQFADVIFANRDLNGILLLRNLISQANRAQRLGFYFSLGYNLSAVGLALAGMIGPLTAAILMPLSSLTLVGITYLHFLKRPTWAS